MELFSRPSAPKLTLLPIALALLSTAAGAQTGDGSGSSWEGLTLFHPTASTTTYLIDNGGAVVHTWPGSDRGGASYLLDDQTLLRSVRSVGGGGAGPGVQLVAWDGSIEWDFRYDDAGHEYHHDIEMLPNGNVLMIVREFLTIADAQQAGRNPAYLSGTVFAPETIIEVQPNGPSGGIIVWEWRLWDHLVQDFDSGRDNYGVVADHPELMDVNYPPNPVADGDWNHANAIAYNAELDQIILNAHHQNEFWIIDHSTTTAEAAGHSGGNSGRGGDMLYRWGNPAAYRAGTAADRKLFGQHNTHWIADNLPGAGNILIFNNGNGRPAGDFSTADEIVPPVDASGVYAYTSGSAYGPADPVWSYQATIPTDFYSRFISGVQRLPNGNTLVCSGVQGWFFEVTADKDVVWEYDNPYPPTGSKSVFRATRYRLCEDPASYCITAPNSMGPGAVIGWNGSASVSANDLVLNASGAAASVAGIFYFGDDQLQIPFGDGYRCVGGSILRLPVTWTDAAGTASYAVDLTDPSLSTSVILSGATWNFQYWFRDTAFGGAGFNLTDGLSVMFCN